MHARVANLMRVWSDFSTLRQDKISRATHTHWHRHKHTQSHKHRCMRVCHSPPHTLTHWLAHSVMGPSVTHWLRYITTTETALPSVSFSPPAPPCIHAVFSRAALPHTPLPPLLPLPPLEVGNEDGGQEEKDRRRMCEGHCETSLIFGEHGGQFLFFSLMFNFIYFISSTHLYCYVFLPHICQHSLIKLHSITANLTLYNCNTLRYNTSNLKKIPTAL